MAAETDFCLQELFVCARYRVAIRSCPETEV